MKKRIFITLAMLYVFGCMVCNSNAHTIILTGTIRDFNDTHPDFERSNCGRQTGLVSMNLGSDKKPVFSNGYSCIESSVTFAQWYNDTVGINKSVPFSVSLDNRKTEAGGIYTYENPDFFPIDNALFGNQNRTHNYHFTYEIHTLFTYQGGEVFTFTGDDDLWVFIDNKLAVDLGGIHLPISVTVELDKLGLTKGKKYDFDLFFAERHTYESNFKIQTSIVLDSQDTCSDYDGDGIIDQWDTCPDTPANCCVTSNGCPCEAIYTQEQVNEIVKNILCWGDMNGDGKIGLEEAINALQVTSCLKSKK